MKEKKEDSDRKLIDVRGRTWATGFSLSKFRKSIRGEAAERIIWLYLYELGMDVKPPEKTCQDMIAVDPITKNEVPVQVKSVSLKRHGYEIRVDDAPLTEFTGFYIALFEKEPVDIKLHIESGKLQRLIRGKKGKMTPGKARHHKDYRALYIPANLKGFEQYLSPDKLKEAVFGRREGN